ncbi:MAG TPA: phage/plasmid primase, P4 family, partial [Marmoricola sp.]|nr:phage/plasmid primase, P4 family [Marmoricola sp.]
MTPEQTEALEIARALTGVGIPVFVAPPDASSTTGYRLPNGWQQTRPDPRVVDAWQPGWALAVVMGHGLDLLDVDPRNGGDLVVLNGSTPTSYGAALTPSGGVHSFIRSLGVRSRDNVAPGIDVKAGDAEGKGRGFAFIAPTVKTSKTTGEPATYRWVSVPDVTRLAAVLRGETADETGARLRAMIEAARAAHAGRGDGEAYDGPPFEQLPEALQVAVRSWVSGAVDGIARELKASAEWTEGQTDDRGRGWEKLQADAALRLGQLARATWNDLELSDAEAAFVAAAPVDGSWGTDDVELKWRQQAHRGDPAPWPDLRSPSERDEEAWRRLGLNPPKPLPGGAGSGADGGDGAPATADASEPGQPMSGEAIAARYFGEGGLQALTLASDVLAQGPLRLGRDNIFWSYAGGVWSPDIDVIEQRLVRLLGQRYRRSHLGTVEGVVKTFVPAITCDPIPELVNFRNGLLDWSAGELGPHSPEVPSTVQLAVDYDPDATCPAFEEFVAQVVPEDVIPTVWELIGYLMYSGNPLHKAVMLTGTGRNGKGTFLRVVEALLDTRNITSVSLSDLVENRFSAASLFGKLANIAGDIDAKYIENTAKFKAITGGDVIPGEHKFKRPFDFVPWAVPMFSANKIPPSADTTVGYLSRWLVVPFPNSFLGREDRTLDKKLQRPEELRGIAARGIAALGRLLARGDFELTESGALAREDFIRRVDQVQTWLAECCSVHVGNPWVARTDLYAAYKQWAFRDGHKPVRASEFYERLEQAGGEPAIMHGTRGFKRIRVQDNGLGTVTMPAP